MSTMTTIMLGQLKNHVQKTLRAEKNDQSIIVTECHFILDFEKGAKQLLKHTIATDSKGNKHPLNLGF